MSKRILKINIDFEKILTNLAKKGVEIPNNYSGSYSKHILIKLSLTHLGINIPIVVEIQHEDYVDESLWKIQEGDRTYERVTITGRDSLDFLLEKGWLTNDFLPSDDEDFAVTSDGPVKKTKNGQWQLMDKSRTYINMDYGKYNNPYLYYKWMGFRCANRIFQVVEPNDIELKKL